MNSGLKEILVEASDNSKDDDREEMKWTLRQEDYIIKIKNECLEFQKQHDIKAHQLKKRYIYFSIPTIVLPLILSSINEFLVQDYNYVNTCGMMISGIISGLNTFFNFGSKYQNHNNFAGKYDNLANEIELLLAKPKRFRVACDVFLERIKYEYTHLLNSAPML